MGGSYEINKNTGDGEMMFFKKKVPKIVGVPGQTVFELSVAIGAFLYRP